ncbi:hypothetical protein ASE23_22820 [Rhizobium sp. Root73]|nr:hypothetical protein ASE23_22820 [Rhizobium sp. Root73]
MSESFLRKRQWRGVRLAPRCGHRASKEWSHVMYGGIPRKARMYNRAKVRQARHDVIPEIGLEVEARYEKNRT